MTYSVEHDPETNEYVATAGDEVFVSPLAVLAYSWLAQQIMADAEGESAS